MTGPLSAGVSAAIAEPGTVQHELGGGIQGRVNGHHIALGSLEWISKHAELHGSSRPVRLETGASPTHSQTEVGLRQAHPASACHSTDARRVSERSTKATLKDMGVVPHIVQAQGQAQDCAQVFLARDGEVVGSMVLSDRVRGDAADTIRQLQDRGYRTVMLTGESVRVMVNLADQPASHLGVVGGHEVQPGRNLPLQQNGIRRCSMGCCPEA